jgi:murein L,D-transpeptidase YafK
VKAALSALLSAALAGAIVTALWLRPEPSPPLGPLTAPIDRIVVEKAARRLTLYRGGHPVRVYAIALGFAPEGDKARQGDGRTPEGTFRIDRRNPNSAFHLSLGIDYPQAEDRARAHAAGVAPGGDIFIHGQPNHLPETEVLSGDWTAGCIAVSNADIREIWAVTPIGAEVTIRP